MRKLVAAITGLMAVLAVAPAAVANPDKTPTVTVTQNDCELVTVTGAGWEPTDATVEVAVRLGEAVVAGPVQVFPDEAGTIAPTVVAFGSTPADGDYTAVVLVDGIVRGESAAFTLSGCTPPPPTVTVERFDCTSVSVSGAGWEQTEATVELAVRIGEATAAGPVQVFPDPDGNIPITTLTFGGTPADGSYTAVVLVDGIVRGESAAFSLAGCTSPAPTTAPPTTAQPSRPAAARPAAQRPDLPATGSSSTMPLLLAGFGLVALGVAQVALTRGRRQAAR